MTLKPVYNFGTFRCNVCIDLKIRKPIHTSTNLLQCSNCKLISYCGQEHQKADWKKHKSICSAVNSILREKNISHLLDVNGPIRNASKTSFQTTRVIMKAVLLVKIKRDLSPFEKEMVWFPKICTVCYEYDAKKLEACSHCGSAFFCQAETHDRSAHSLYCAELKLHYGLCVENYPSLYPGRLPPITFNAKTLFPEDLLKILQESTTLNLSRNLSSSPSSQSDYERFASICNHSNVATLLFVLQKVQATFQERLIVHIVGVSTEISLFTESECWLLFHWLPKLQRIELFFIGPELPTSSCTEFEYSVGESAGFKKSIFLQYNRQKYEDFWSGKSRGALPSPHTVICFNSGFSEFEDIPLQPNPWRPALVLMLKAHKGVPLAFTSYTKLEAKVDLCLVRSIAEQNNINIETLIDGIRNPYRDMRPYRNWENSDDDEIFYCNGYLNAVVRN